MHAKALSWEPRDGTTALVEAFLEAPLTLRDTAIGLCPAILDRGCTQPYPHASPQEVPSSLCPLMSSQTVVDANTAS